jgi:hypothetical protein
MEISQDSIKETSIETKTKLTDDLFRLLQVREKNKDMVKDWLLFLSSSKFNKLTPGEIYLAFKMAIGREILDNKGNEIDVLPELSNNTTGKVLSAFIKYKADDEAYQLAKEKLRQLTLPTFQEPSDEQKKVIRERFLMTVFVDMVKNKFSSDAWLLYNDLQDRIFISADVKRRLYRIQNGKHIKELQAEVSKNGNREYHKQILADFQKKSGSGNKSAVVQNKCKSIVISNYLKKHLQDFESFKKAIDQSAI